VTPLPGDAEPEKPAALCTVAPIRGVRRGLYFQAVKGAGVSTQRVSLMYPAICASGFERSVAGALAGPATDSQRALVQRLSMIATPRVVETIRCCNQVTHINK